MPSNDSTSQGTIRRHANFQSRTATDDANVLNRQSTIIQEDGQSTITNAANPQSEESQNPYEPATNSSNPPPKQHSLTKRLLHLTDSTNEPSKMRKRSTSGRRKSHSVATPQDLLTLHKNNEAENKKANGNSTVPKTGLGPRPIGGMEKLGLFSGVYVPTCLNVLSILMFLRFGFILGR